MRRPSPLCFAVFSAHRSACAFATTRSSSTAPTRLRATSYDVFAERCRWMQRMSDDTDATTPVVLVEKSEWAAWRSALSENERNWVDAMLPGGWKSGGTVALPGESGGPSRFAACVDHDTVSKTHEAAARLAGSLPDSRVYRLSSSSKKLDGSAAALGWCLGAYEFEAYKKPKTSSETTPSQLLWPEECDRDATTRAARGTYLVRDLISSPAEDMGPASLEAATRALGDHYGAKVSSVVGDDLLEENFPMVHAVGRAAPNGREPRVVELDWTPSRTDGELPLVVLVGKGVTFDTGGLDIKPPAAMLTMKKDMGGAAHVLGLADMVMAANLPVRLKVLLGCVENSISGASFRPGDVLTARNGYTTEIGNTDAEGRLVLGDLLVLAEESRPDIIIDIATLTGAGRVALGTAVPALFCNDDQVADALLGLSSEVADDVWRLPLWPGYENELDSKIADCKNIGNGPYGGAITAALYLQRFLKSADAASADGDDKKTTTTTTPWIHIDCMAYNTKTTPLHPEGGEAMSMRSLFALLADRYS